jgi:hypothetical protein
MYNLQSARRMLTPHGSNIYFGSNKLMGGKTNTEKREAEQSEAKSDLYSGLYCEELENIGLTVSDIDGNLNKALSKAWSELKDIGFQFDHDLAIREMVSKLHFLKDKERLLKSMGVDVDLFQLYQLPEPPSTGVLQSICRYSRIGKKLYSALLAYAGNDLDSVCEDLSALAHSHYGKTKEFTADKIKNNAKVSRFKVPSWEYSLILTFLAEKSAGLLNNLNVDVVAEYWCVKEVYQGKSDRVVAQVFCKLFNYDDDFIAEKLISHKIRYDKSQKRG